MSSLSALIFPRKKNIISIFLIGFPEEILGFAAASSWMNSNLFVKVLELVVKHRSASKNRPNVAFMDNHKSHLSAPALEFATSSEIHFVILLPLTSHKTQPLDRTVFGPLKNILMIMLTAGC